MSKRVENRPPSCPVCKSTKMEEYLGECEHNYIYSRIAKIFDISSTLPASWHKDAKGFLDVQTNG